MRDDNRNERAWVKVQLKDDHESWQVADIVAYWKHLKTAARHVRRAIVIYEALMRGDIEPLLTDFPMLRTMMNNAPAAPAPRPSAPPKPIKKRETQKSKEEDLDDFLSSMGI